MDTILDNSPYRSGDPTVCRANLSYLAGVVYGGKAGEPDVALMGTLPCCQIPFVTPAGAANDRDRGAALFALPYPYLPATLWMRRPGEYAGSYQMRLMCALDALGLIAVDEANSSVWFDDIEGVPDDPDALASIAAAFDGRGRNDTFDAIRADMAKRCARVWPNGYDDTAMIEFGRQLAALCMRGSAVLAGQRALALASLDDPEARRNAVDILNAARNLYGPLFTPDLTPDGVRRWVRDNAPTAVDMLDQLAEAGLDVKGNADAAREILAGI